MMNNHSRKQNSTVEYAAFLDEPTYFNLISTLHDENAFLLRTHQMLVTLSSAGILMEIEIMGIVSRSIEKCTFYYPENIIQTLSVFDIKNPHESLLIVPELFFNEEKETAILLLANQKSDLMYEYRNLRFFMHGNNLNAIQIYGAVREQDDSKQSILLKERGVVDEWD